MGTSIKIFIILFFVNIKVYCQKDFDFFSFNANVPIIQNVSSEKMNFTADLSVFKSIYNNTFSSIGILYTKSDTKTSTTRLTFDTEILGFYLKSFYTLKLNKKIQLNPEIRYGYAFYDYSYNDYIGKRIADDGFFFSGGIDIMYQPIKNILLGPSINYFIILKDLKRPPIIPYTYTIIPKRVNLFNVNLKLGIVI